MIWNGIVASAVAAALVLPGAGQARSLSGAYLAGIQAEQQLDYEEAARYFVRALSYDVDNPALLDAAIRAQVARGEVSTAIVLAQRLEETDTNPLGLILQLAGNVRDGQLTPALETLSNPQAQESLPLLADIWRGWLLINTGEEEDGFEALRDLALHPEWGLFGQNHLALAHVALGDYDAAAQVFADLDPVTTTLHRFGTRVRIEAQAKAGETRAALDLVDTLLEGSIGDVELETLRAALTDGNPVQRSMAGPMDGFAIALFDIGSQLNTGRRSEALLYLRVAHFLKPDLHEAALLIGQILEQQDQFDLARQVFETVPLDAPQSAEARLGLAAVYQSAERDDEAIATLSALAQSYPEALRVRYFQAEALRVAERYEDALPIYDQSVDLAVAQDRAFWQLYYGRAVSKHLTDDWPGAEADFRRALELRPDQPMVLNYLGYSLVEKGLKLDEALGMIQSAVEQRPDSGYIIDSLGWVYFQLGRYDEAVDPMEQAVALEPIDPVINDHLGDVYWMVGREREAEFQWRRALSFDPEPEERARILRKLDIGLDAVRAEEGHSVAN
nr:tetratricopeptide repeat protein [Rubricella aquisinus]